MLERMQVVDLVIDALAQKSITRKFIVLAQDWIDNRQRIDGVPIPPEQLTDLENAIKPWIGLESRDGVVRR